MPNRKKIPTADGGEIEVEPIPYRSGAENWNEYLLEDRTVLKLKTVVTEIVRVVDKYDAEGNPVYLVKSTNVVSVDAPESLRRRGNA